MSLSQHRYAVASAPCPSGIEDVVAGQQVRTVFQPIVHLDTGSLAGYEALSRGPAGELENPVAMFAAAQSAGLLAELDELCRETALRTAIAAGIAAPLTLFVNVEPGVVELRPLVELATIAKSAPERLNLVLELTERALGSRPAELLETVQHLRSAGWRIALDDVGAEDMSMAFMSLLRPDIIKLDLQLVQRRPNPAIAEIMNAVNAHAERTGCLLLAEGIEDEKHLAMARALGARLGQGWMFGRPTPILATLRPAKGLDLPRLTESPTKASPFKCLPGTMQLRLSGKPLLIEVSKHLERQAAELGSTCILLTTFQHAKHFTSSTERRYRALAAKVGFVAAIGEGISPHPAPGVRGGDLSADDPLHSEWDIVVLAPHFAAALIARDLGDTGPGMERSFEFALTYDRETVTAAAASLMSRIRPANRIPG